MVTTPGCDPNLPSGVKRAARQQADPKKRSSSLRRGVTAISRRFYCLELLAVGRRVAVDDLPISRPRAGDRRERPFFPDLETTSVKAKR